MSVKAIPEGYTTVTPYLIIRGVSEAIKFYEKAFGASEVRRMEADGKIMHAEIKIGNGHLMLADEFPDQGFCSPQALGGSPAFIHLYVENADASFERAVNAGAKSLQPVSDQIFGDRHGLVQDPFGYTWTIATHIADISTDELKVKIQEYAKLKS
jgi:PhnB protein